MLAGKIESSDFKILKMDYDNKVHAINLRLTAIKERFKDKFNIQPMVINAIRTLCNLHRLYQTATIEDKRHLVETIFNGMLIYDKDGYRTTNLNPIAEITYLKARSYKDIKKGQKTFKNLLSHYGSIVSLNVNHFIEQLIDIGDYYKIIEDE